MSVPGGFSRIMSTFAHDAYRHLFCAIAEAPGLGVSELHAYMGYSRPAVSRKLAHLRALGWIDETAPENDGRSRMLRLAGDIEYVRSGPIVQVAMERPAHALIEMELTEAEEHALERLARQLRGGRA